MKYLAVFKAAALAIALPALAGADDAFVAITPCRVVDTREAGFGGVLPNSTRRDFTITGGVTVPPFGPCVIPNTGGGATSRLDMKKIGERRVGKECSELCRSRWSPYH